MGTSVAPRAEPRRTSMAPNGDRRTALLVSRLPLADGLRVCLGLADAGSPCFEVAALRWHSCFCSRAVALTLADAQDALAALGGLNDHGRRLAARDLLELSLRYQQEESAEVLCWWLGNR